MKRFFSIQFLVLCGLLATAQQIELRWLPVATLTADTLSTQAVSLENGMYARCSQLPSLVVDLNNANIVEIESPIFSELSGEELKIATANSENIPHTLYFEQFVQTERKVSKHKLEIFPFIQENGKFKKLLSFEIKSINKQKSVQKAVDKKARYAENSVLKSGKFVKIAIEKSGIYKLTYEDLTAMGVNPQKVRIFGYGGAMLAEDFSKPYIDDLPEIAIYEHKGDDGIFGAGDYILFYGQGVTSWAYSNAYGLFRHTQNVYSNQGHYFVTSDAGTGKRITTATALETTPTDTITSFTDYFVHEKDLKNLIASGREFYGEEFGGNKTSYSFSYSLPNILAETASVRLDVAARSQLVANFTINVNGEKIGTLTTSSILGEPVYIYAKTSTMSKDFTPKASNELNINLTFSNATGLAWLNYFELNLKRKLKITDSQPFFFRNIDSLFIEMARCFKVEGATSTTQIWDISDQSNIQRMPSNYANGNLTFTDSVHTLKQYVAVNPTNSTFLTPTVVGTVGNQNLHALPQTDMVIIAPKEFLSEAERLADAHRTIQGLSVHVVEKTQIYNEFASGTPDVTAYRRLMKMFYDRAENEADMPRYLLLFGDGVYDNRHIETPAEYGKLLTFQSYNSVHGTASYVCDDYLAFLDDTEGVNITKDAMDIGVGRFPVYTAEQAKIAVDKSISYLENRLTGSWKNQLMFVADDGDNNLHIKGCDSVAQMTTHNYPDLLVRKLYLDAYTQEVSASGETYPLVTELFDNYIKNGTLMINYMGHGGHYDWTNEGILTHDRIVNMYNEKLPLFVTATCDFSRFDGISQSGGELLLLNSHGGAISLFTTTRTVYAERNVLLNLQFAKYIFDRNSDGRPLCFGDVMRKAKNGMGTDANKMNFTLLGDPAIELAYAATHDVITDSITLFNAEDIATDTIRALSKVRIHGHISQENQTEIDTDFNGYISLNVFDKEETIKTLCNDATENANNVPYIFVDRTSALFVGQSQVTDGKFVTEFIVPKDIRYNYGSGRIVYYAADTINNYEANGYYEQFIVGGEDPYATPDNESPQIQIYLNAPTFKSGDKTNESPLFVAEIHDESGINAIGSGIGHDIILKLDNDPKQEINLNSYYTANFGEYTNGTVKYQLSNLTEGKHRLLFRIWDLQNNSSTAELDFEVVKGLKPNVVEMYAYPNPASTSATFVYVHDRPEQPLSVSAIVSDLAGRVVYRGEQTVFTYDNRTEVTWDFASSISPGIYLVRMSVQVSDSEIATKTIKLMVQKQ